MNLLIDLSVTRQLGAGINIPPNATTICEKWGIIEDIRGNANVPSAAFMRSYDSTELFSTELGPPIEGVYHAPYMVIHRADLHGSLLKEARRLEVRIKLNSHITTLNLSEPSVDLSTCEKYTADIILGADGEKSACRDALLCCYLPSQDSGDNVFHLDPAYYS